MNKNSDMVEFAGMLAQLGAVFRVDVAPAMIDGYWSALDDIPLGALKAAAREIARSGVHFPRPKELRDLCTKSAENAAATAWDTVLKLSTNCRAAEHPDPIAEQCVRELGGWRHFGSMDVERFKTWVRKEFLALYQAKAKDPNEVAAIEARRRAEIPSGEAGAAIAQLAEAKRL